MVVLVFFDAGYFCDDFWTDIDIDINYKKKKNKRIWIGIKISRRNMNTFIQVLKYENHWN